MAIIGIGSTRHARRRPDVDYAELALEAIDAALDEAGIGLLDVDHAVTASLDFVDGRTIANMSTAEVTGSYRKPESRLCGDGANAILYALAKMRSGHYRYGLVVAHAKESQGRHHDIENAAFDPFTERRLGPDGDVVAALAAQRVFETLGVTVDDAAEAVVAARAAGRDHPWREPLEEIGVDDVLAAPPLSTPLTTLSKAPPTDGAVALVVATEEVVRERRLSPVWVAGVGASTAPYWTDRDLADTSALASARDTAVRMAGWDDHACDVVELSAQFGHQVLQFSPVLGAGDAGAVNTPSGGWLAGGAQVISGLDRVVACVEQLRGTAGTRQVAGASRALAHGIHGLGAQTHAVVALEGDAA
jgi:acetyl-CoA C-acetyltransferase